MQSFSKEEILKLTESPSDFKNAIINSKGFIFYLSEKFNITFSKELLLDTINIYSIQYLTEHIKTLNLSKDEITTVMQYLTEDNDDQKIIVNTKYSLNDLITDLQNEKKPNSQSLKQIKLTFDDFLRNVDTLSLLLVNSDDGFYRSFVESSVYSSHPLLQSIFKDISKDDFLKINFKYLAKYPAYFNMASYLLDDDEIKLIYNKSLEQFYQQDDIKQSGYKLSLDAYENYHFKKHEKDFFITLLKKKSFKDYSKVQSFIGFNHFFTKNEYIIEYNIEDIDLLSDNDIKQNIDRIQTSILNQRRGLESFFNLELSKESLDLIFTQNFLLQYISIHGLNFEHYDKDYHAKNLKMKFFYDKIYHLCAENDEALSIVGFQNIVKNMKETDEYHKKLINQEQLNSFLKIINKFSQSIKTENLFSNLNKSYLYSYTYLDIPKLIVESMQNETPTINYLYFLTSIVKNDSSWRKNIYEEEIKRIVPLLNKDDVKQISFIEDYHFKKMKKNIKQDFSNNFLATTPENITSLSLNNFRHLFFLDNNFRQMILKSNLDNIFIDFCEKIKSASSYSNVISWGLNNLDEKSETYPFFKEFIKRNKQYMLDNHLSQLITHPLRNKLINIDTKQIEEDSFNKINSLLDKYVTISNSYQLLNSNRDDLSTEKKKQTQKQLDLLKKDKELLEKEFSEFNNNISFNFFNQKIQESNPIQAIRLALVNNKKEFTKTTLDKFYNLTFQDTMKSIENSEVLSFIYEHRKHSNSRDEQNFYFNPSFSNEQNIQIIEKLLKNFNNENLIKKQYVKVFTLSELLYLIDQKRVTEISNDLVIKHDPLEMFNSYDFAPNCFVGRHVEQIFSTEQILQSINNLKKQNLTIFGKAQTNSSYDNCLSNNYKIEGHHFRNNSPNPYLNDYKNLLKALEKDPVNYLAVCHHDIIENFIYSSDEKIMKDVLVSDFVNKYINIDVILKSFKEVIDLYKEHEKIIDSDSKVYKGVFLKDAINAITSFISFTYYHNDSEKKYESKLDDDKSIKIIELLCKEAPFLTLSISSVGKVNVEEYISKNFNKCFPNVIDSFFERNDQESITSEYLSITYEKRNEQWQSIKANKIIENIEYNIKHNNDKNSLYKLDYILKSEDFNEEERPWGKKVYDFNTVMTSFINNESFKDNLKYNLAAMRTMELHDKLTPKDNSVKIKKNKI